MSANAFIVKIAAMLQVDPEAVNEATAIAPDQWDSVDVLDLIAAIDESFGATVEIKQLNRCTTVGELRALIEKTRGAA